MTIRANNSVPVQLPTSLFAMMMGVFLVGVAVWTVALVRHFRTPQA